MVMEKILGKGKKNGDKNGNKKANAGGNGHDPRLDMDVLNSLLAGQKQQAEIIDQQGKVLSAVVAHLQQSQAVQSQAGIHQRMTEQSKKDVIQMVIQPSADVAPSLAVLPPIMCHLLPMLDVVKWNYADPDDLPKDEVTGKTLGFYEIWERSLYAHSKSKDGKHLIRLTGVGETQTEQRGLGIDAS